MLWLLWERDRVKIRIGFGLGTNGLPAPHDQDHQRAYCSFIDQLEQCRYDSVWFSERVSGWTPDPVVAMAFAAARTTKLKLGMSVMVLPGRNPALVAKELASLDVLSNGRLLPAFGLGVADGAEQAAFGVRREDRAPLFDETLAVIRRLWTEDNVVHEGRFLRLSGVTVRPHPAQRPPDVWLGGFAPSELRRVGRLADGWLPSFLTPADAGAKKVDVERAAADAGRVIDPEHFGALIIYSLDGDVGPLVERVRARRPDVDIADLVPVGAAAIRDHLRRYIDEGFSKFVLVPAGSRDKDQLRAELDRLAEDVLPLQR